MKPMFIKFALVVKAASTVLKLVAKPRPVISGAMATHELSDVD